MLKATIKPTEKTSKLFAKLQAATGEYKKRIPQILSKFAWLVISRAQTTYLTSGPLHVRTNRLRSSVKKSAVKYGNKEYSVTVGTNVKYGKWWEEGFSVPAHDIFAKNKKVPKFMVAGEPVFVKKVHIPERTEGERPWLKPAIYDYKIPLDNALKEFGREAVTL